VETVVVTKEVPVEVTKIVEVTKEVLVTPTPVKFRRGGTLVVGLAERVMTLDPHDFRHRGTETVLRNMFDGLVTRTREGDVVLEIAESVEMIEPTVWEFKIKKGIKFHNGEDLTAEDVKFSFDRTITEGAIECPEPHTSPRKGLIAPLERVEIVDDYTVRFHLTGPWPVLMQMLCHHLIMPKDYYEEVGCEGFRKHPVGAGPFKFVEAKLDEYVVMERFEEYYGGAEDLPPVGPAFLDRVIFKIIPEASTRVAALKAGEVDIIHMVPAHLIPTLAVDPNVRVKTCTGTRPHWMEMNVTKPPFDDVRVRQALNYAVNVDLIVEEVLGGLAIVLPGPLSPLNKFADPTLKPYGYDPEKALALLEEAGWKDTDGDGVLDKDGKPFSFVIDVWPGTKEYAEAVAGQLREIGIDASVRVWDYAVLKPLLLAGERMAYLGSWGDSAFDPVGHMEAKWRTGVPGTGKGRGNFSQYSNPRVDELIDAGEVEADVEKRREIYYEAQRIIYEEAPAIFLFVPKEVEACRVRVQNWAPSPDSRINLHDVWVLE
ncbi:MAG TPA: ABC transporter substrate-binding protein, partial [Anaerolineae bacterium]|nr:ABC transporter substrate-binding protein [Anaerolineae bacterium]